MSTTFNEVVVKKLIHDMLDPKFKYKECMSSFIIDVLSRNYNGTTEFMLAYTNSFPKLLYSAGDRVRVFGPPIYNINWEASREKGYAVDEGLFVEITEAMPYREDSYRGNAIYINERLEEDSRMISFNASKVANDNTVVPACVKNIADII